MRRRNRTQSRRSTYNISTRSTRRGVEEREEEEDDDEQEPLLKNILQFIKEKADVVAFYHQIRNNEYVVGAWSNIINGIKTTGTSVKTTINSWVYDNVLVIDYTVDGKRYKKGTRFSLSQIKNLNIPLRNVARLAVVLENTLVEPATADRRTRRSTLLIGHLVYERLQPFDDEGEWAQIYYTKRNIDIRNSILTGQYNAGRISTKFIQPIVETGDACLNYKGEEVVGRISNKMSLAFDLAIGGILAGNLVYNIAGSYFSSAIFFATKSTSDQVIKTSKDMVQEKVLENYRLAKVACPSLARCKVSTETYYDYKEAYQIAADFLLPSCINLGKPMAEKAGYEVGKKVIPTLSIVAVSTILEKMVISIPSDIKSLVLKEFEKRLPYKCDNKNKDIYKKIKLGKLGEKEIDKLAYEVKKKTDVTMKKEEIKGFLKRIENQYILGTGNILGTYGGLGVAMSAGLYAISREVFGVFNKEGIVKKMLSVCKILIHGVMGYLYYFIYSGQAKAYVIYCFKTLISIMSTVKSFIPNVKIPYISSVMKGMTEGLYESLGMADATKADWDDVLNNIPLVETSIPVMWFIIQASYTMYFGYILYQTDIKCNLLLYMTGQLDKCKRQKEPKKKQALYDEGLKF